MESEKDATSDAPERQVEREKLEDLEPSDAEASDAKGGIKIDTVGMGSTVGRVQP